MENQILDNILSCMKDTPHNTFSSIKIDAKSKNEFLKNIDDKMFLSALLKLVKDEYIEQEYQSVGTMRGNLYYITFDGLFFLNRGGYTAQEEEYQTQQNEIASIKKRQDSLQKATYRLSWAVAIGTSVASIYYGIEIYKYIKLNF